MFRLRVIHWHHGGRKEYYYNFDNVTDAVQRIEGMKDNHTFISAELYCVVGTWAKDITQRGVKNGQATQGHRA